MIRTFEHTMPKYRGQFAENGFVNFNFSNTENLTTLTFRLFDKSIQGNSV